MKAYLARALAALLAAAVLMALPLPASAAKPVWLFEDFYAGMKRSEIHENLTYTGNRTYHGDYRTLGGRTFCTGFMFNNRDELFAVSFFTNITGSEAESARWATRYVESFAKILFHEESRGNIVLSITEPERNRSISNGLYAFCAMDSDVYNAATGNGSSPRSLTENLRGSERVILVDIARDHIALVFVGISSCEEGRNVRRGLNTYYSR